MNAPEDKSSRRTGFFGYFRKRANTGVRPDLSLPDRLIFLSACLDALAGHWYATADRATTAVATSSLDRLRLFLLRHGQHAAFEKVSAPMFRNATNAEVGAFPFASYKRFAMNEVRDWRDDPTFSELEGEGDRNALLRWSYPGILYVDFRCAWVHKFMHENEQVMPADRNNFDREEPYYRFRSDTENFLLVIPFSFLSKTVERAIESFEQEAESRDILPFED